MVVLALKVVTNEYLTVHPRGLPSPLDRSCWKQGSALPVSRSFMALYVVGTRVLVTVLLSRSNAKFVVQLSTLGRPVVLTHVPTPVSGDARLAPREAGLGEVGGVPADDWPVLWAAGSLGSGGSRHVTDVCLP